MREHLLSTFKLSLPLIIAQIAQLGLGLTDVAMIGWYGTSELAALTLGHTQGLQFHTQNLHAAGFEVNQMNASGIVTANTFSGSGASLTSIPASQLTGESSTKIVGSDGNNNTLAGTGAGSNLTSGANNLILGKSAQASSATVDNEIVLGDSNITKFRIPGINFVLKDHASTPLEGQVLTVGPGGEASFQTSGSGVSEPKAIAFAIALG